MLKICKEKWEENKKNLENTLANDETLNSCDYEYLVKLAISEIMNSSKENDIVFDPFSGSGTTCVLSKELKRRFIGIEKLERYHKISTDRLKGITATGQISLMADFEDL